MNSFAKGVSSSKTPYWRYFLPSNTETTSLPSGRSLPARLCPWARCNFDCQFRSRGHRSCTLKTKKSLLGPTTMTKTPLAAFVWELSSRSDRINGRLSASSRPYCSCQVDANGCASVVLQGPSGLLDFLDD